MANSLSQTVVLYELDLSKASYVLFIQSFEDQRNNLQKQDHCFAYVPVLQ